MSNRRKLDRHLRSLADIADIIKAMRNLAWMETRKLTKFLATQHRVVETIRAAAEEFLAFRPDVPGRNAATRHALIVIGSERGFCGDLNGALRRSVDALQGLDGDASMFVVGSRLSSLLRGDPRVIAHVAGPAAAEDVLPVLTTLVQAIGRWQAAQRTPCPVSLRVLHHRPGNADITTMSLTPFAQWEERPPRPGYPSLLTLPPRAFLEKLADEYLFAALHEMFYASLMAESEYRRQHMDTALHRLDQRTAEFRRKRNGLRQEEITEEIELIMLNAEAPPAPS